MLRIYLNKRLVKLETDNLVEDNLQKGTKCPFRFTGKKVFLIMNWVILLFLRGTLTMEMWKLKK